MAEIGITSAGKRNDRIYREGAPVGITGKVGQLYIDVTNNDVYVCTSQGTWLKAISDGAIAAGGMSKKLIANTVEVNSGTSHMWFKDSNGNVVKLKSGKTYLLNIDMNGYVMTFVFNYPEDYSDVTLGSTSFCMPQGTELVFMSVFFDYDGEELVFNAFKADGTDIGASLVPMFTAYALYELS